VADPKIVGGDVVEPSSRRPRGGRVWGGGIPLPTEGGYGEGAVAVPPPQNFFSILDLKMGSFGALWVPVGMHPHPPGSATDSFVVDL